MNIKLWQVLTSLIVAAITATLCYSTTDMIGLAVIVFMICSIGTLFLTVLYREG